MASRDNFFWSAIADVPMKVTWERVEGVSTRILEFGSPRAPALLLAHGTGGHAEAFIHNVRALAQEHRVILYDLPGHGWSESTGAPYTIADYVRHLDALLDRLNLSSFGLCGLSLGGWIAARFASREHGRIEYLVLVGCGGLDADTSAMQPVKKQSLSVAEVPDLSGVRRRLELIMADKSHVTEELVRCRAAMYSVADGARRIRYGLHLQEPSIRSANILRADELARIQVPTLVLTGDSDPIIAPAKSRRLASLISDAEFHELRDAGHWPQFEQPDQFNSVVLGFTTRQTAPRKDFK